MNLMLSAKERSWSSSVAGPAGSGGSESLDSTDGFLLDSRRRCLRFCCLVRLFSFCCEGSCLGFSGNRDGGFSAGVGCCLLARPTAGFGRALYIRIVLLSCRSL